MDKLDLGCGDDRGGGLGGSGRKLTGPMREGKVFFGGGDGGLQSAKIEGEKKFLGGE